MSRATNSTRPSYHLFWIPRHRPSMRSRTVLAAKIAKAASKPISSADGPGRIYLCHNSPTEWKLGRSKNVPRRKKEWGKQCPNRMRKWVWIFESKHAHRTGIFSFSAFRSVDLTLRQSQSRTYSPKCIACALHGPTAAVQRVRPCPSPPCFFFTFAQVTENIASYSSCEARQSSTVFTP